MAAVEAVGVLILFLDIGARFLVSEHPVGICHATTSTNSIILYIILFAREIDKARQKFPGWVVCEHVMLFGEMN
jgi:hypothetical protein